MAGANRGRSPYYGALQEVVDSLFGEDSEAVVAVLKQAGDSPAERMAALVLNQPKVRRLDVVMAAEAVDLPDDLREIVELLPPGSYTRRRLCDQLNSAIGGHAWGQVYGTVQ